MVSALASLRRLIYPLDVACIACPCWACPGPTRRCWGPSDHYLARHDLGGSHRDRPPPLCRCARYPTGVAREMVLMPHPTLASQGCVRAPMGSSNPLWLAAIVNFTLAIMSVQEGGICLRTCELS